MIQPVSTITSLLHNAPETRLSLIHGGDDRRELTFATLQAEAHQVAAGLLAAGCQPRDSVVLFVKSNAAFLPLFWGCLSIGLIPVPLAAGKGDEHRRKLAAVVDDLGGAWVVGDQEAIDVGRWLAFSELKSEPEIRPSYEPEPTETAFIQYSSGSTGRPKGVVLTHRNLVANIRAIHDGMEWDPSGIGLSWMPLTHDMGLIVMHLTFVYGKMRHGIIDTDVFVRRPVLWLEEATRMGATALCSPNFGYKHFLKVFERRGSSELDLSSVKTIFNGAEPISDEQCRVFMSAMEPHGLSPDAMCPVYGLAEATVGVSIPPHRNRYQTVTLNRHHLNTGEYCEPHSSDSPDAVTFVKVGEPIADVEVRIVDADDKELANGHIGFIQLKGASVTRGYLNDPAPEQTFTADGWLRTGDCGAFIDRQLIITGRAKDIIIVNGQNYYAHDLEGLTYDLAEMELGKIIVAGSMRPMDSVEQLVLFLLHRGERADFEALASKCAQAIQQAAQIHCDFAVPVTRVPKTTSGKVQRSLLAKNFANGEYDTIAFALTHEANEPGSGAASSAESTLDILVRLANAQSGGVLLGQDDDLFDAGISSLTLTEIVLSFEEVFPGKVSIDELFDYPTLSKLATHIDGAAAD